jgi:hypothetical protein
MEWLMSLWHKRHSLSDPIKEYDRIVDGRPEARKQLEQTIDYAPSDPGCLFFVSMAANKLSGVNPDSEF